MRNCLLLIITLLASNPAHAEICNADLDTVLRGYVAARGGYDALEKQTALRIVSTNHEGKWNPEFDYRVMKPGYMWIEAAYDDGEIIYEGFDGERGWEKWGTKEAEYVSGDAGKALNQGAQSPVHLYGLHHMASLGAKVTFEGCETIESKSYYVINVVSRFNTDIGYYINRDSFRLERSRTERPLHPTQDPTPITIEERWTEFRYVEGVLHPFGYSQWNVDTDEKLNWLEIHRIEVFNEASVAFFAKPK